VELVRLVLFDDHTREVADRVLDDQLL